MGYKHARQFTEAFPPVSPAGRAIGSHYPSVVL